MRKARKRATWAILICLLAGAGINVVYRIFEAGHDLSVRPVLNIPASRLDVFEACVRMANSGLIQLAHLLDSCTTPGVSTHVLDDLRANPRQTRSFSLRRTVPLPVKYDLVDVRDGALVTHPNVSLDTLVAAAGPEVR